MDYRDIQAFEEAELAACPACSSVNTAKVICGVIGRAMHIVGATRKATLIANGPAPGAHFCHACDAFFKRTARALPRSPCCSRERSSPLHPCAWRGKECGGIRDGHPGVADRLWLLTSTEPGDHKALTLLPFT